MTKEEVRRLIKLNHGTQKAFLEAFKDETGVSIDFTVLSHILRGTHEMSKFTQAAFVLFFKDKKI